MPRRKSSFGPRPPHSPGFPITLRHTTISRTPPDEGRDRHRDLYLTIHSNHKRETSMPPAGFAATIPASERPQTHALDSAATGIGKLHYCLNQYYMYSYKTLTLKLSMLRNIDAAEVKEPIAKGLSKTTADGVRRTSKNCPNTWTKRSKQKQKVKAAEGRVVYLFEGSKNCTKLEANKYRRRVAMDLIIPPCSRSHTAIQENSNPSKTFASKSGTSHETCGK